VLKPRFQRTDAWSCVTDALNFAAGHVLISKKIANAISQDPLQFNPLDNAKVKTALAGAGVLLLRVEQPQGTTIGMAHIMGQTEGMFLVKYKGRGEAVGEEIRHCVTRCCLRRIAFCNENGVYPFNNHTDPNHDETKTRHNQLKGMLDVCKIECVYRVLFDVTKYQMGKTRVHRERAEATQPDNKRQKQT
jgi:hypothetical protein